MVTFFKRPLFALCAVFLGAAVSAADEESIKWYTNFDEAKAAAAKENKLIFADMYAEWCPPCKMLDTTTWVDPGVVKLLNTEFIALKMDADKEPDFLEKYSDGSLPTLAMIDAKGRLLESGVGYLDPAAFQEWIGEARHAGEELDALEAKVKAAPEDVKAALDLANRYVRMHDGPKAAELLAGISDDAAARLSPEDQAQLLYTRAMTQFDAEDYEKAVASVQAFMQRFPDDPRSADMGQYVLQGNFLAARKAFRNGDIEKAKKSYEKLAQDTSVPGAAEAAKMELARLERFGKPAPALQVEEWMGGEPIDLASLKGKVVVVDFLQIIDPFNETSRPALAALQEKYGEKGLRVIGVASAFDSLEQQTPEAIKQYVADNKYPYPVGIDREHSTTFTAFGGMGSPWTAIIDQDGNIVYLDFFDTDRVTAKIEALLGS